MIQILRMTASFGCLDNETLTLQPGLNILSRPNESGKSTWAAFLNAMLYGIDTRERTSKGVLPAKVKFQPWSGKMMEGTVELLWNGRPVTITRQSDRRTPMGKFAAFDTLTGETIQELTGENCGRMLLGVEQSVFCRSAFIGQNAIEVTPDAGLEQRMAALVTTGDETVSYTQTARRLRDWKNHVKHNRTGYLPQTEQALAETEETLRAIHTCHREDMELAAQRQELEKRQTQLVYIEENLRAQQEMEKMQQLDKADKTLRDAEDKASAATEKAAALPSRERLLQLQRALQAFSIRRELQENETAPAPPAAPAVPPAFRDMTAQEAEEAAARDAAELASASAVSGKGRLLAGIALLLVAAVTGLLVKMLWLLPLLAGAALTVWHLAAAGREKKRRESRKRQLLSHYGAEDAAGIQQAAAVYAASQLRFREEMAQYEVRRAEWEAEKASLQAQETSLLAAVRDFAVNIYTVENAEEAVHRGIQEHAEAEKAAQRLESARQARDAVQAAVGQTQAAKAPVEDFSQTHRLPQVVRELELVRQQLAEICETLAQHEGKVAALGDPAALEAEKQQLQQKGEMLTRRFAALELAEEVLSEANAGLQGRFSPQISQTAGELLGSMTDGRYDAVRMGKDLTLWARETGGAVPRELLSLSGGTADQLYLALRLALCRMVSEDAPLVLDDALVYFDDVRLGRVMALLQAEAEHRQILLFTCQNREQAALQA